MGSSKEYLLAALTAALLRERMLLELVPVVRTQVARDRVLTSLAEVEDEIIDYQRRLSAVVCSLN